MSRIQQQIYTREREGIFNSTPGYDTIARSKGLDKSFIKNVIHPLCFYNPPRELTTLGERDERKYPVSRLITFLDTGELILGQSVYKESDYTGERETFLSHNYIIPKDRGKDYIYSADGVFRNISFRKEYSLTSGKELEELNILPSENTYRKSLNAVLEELHITAEQFQQLVFAIISSITSKKKVYVSLPGEVSSASEAAIQLTYYLFLCLPYELRRSFGFISYADEPKSKKNVNLMFVEKGSIRPNDSLISKDYVFDFAQGDHMNLNENIESHLYIKFAFENLSANLAKLDDFYAFAEMALSDKENISLQLYDDLLSLYSIKDGNYSKSNYSLSALFRRFRLFLTPENIKKKSELYDLLVKLVDEERLRISEKSLPNEETLLEVIHFTSFFAPKDQDKIIIYLIMSLYYGSSDLNYVTRVYKYLKKDSKLFSRVVSMVFKNPSFISFVIETYLKATIKNIPSLKELLEEVNFWLNHNPEVAGNQVFDYLAKEQIITFFQKERDLLKTFENVKRKLNGTRFAKQDEGVNLFNKSILDTLSFLVIKGLKIESLKAEEFDQAYVIAVTIPKDIKNHEIDEKLKFIYSVQDILGKRQISDPEQYARSSNFGKLQAIILKLLPPSQIVQHFDKIALGFYNRDHRYENMFRYDQMFSYVHSNGGLDAMRNFLKPFIMLWGGAHLKDPAFKRSAYRYLSDHSKEILSDKRTVNRWERVHLFVKKALNDIKFQQKSALGKFLYKHKHGVMIGLTIFLVILLGAGVFTYKYNSDKKAKELAYKKAEEAIQAVAVERRNAQTLTLQAYDIKYEDTNSDGLSDSDKLKIFTAGRIDSAKVSNFKYLKVYYEDEYFDLKKISQKDVNIEPNYKSAEIIITNNNLNNTKKLAKKVMKENKN